jgi:hypothetical protein
MRIAIVGAPGSGAHQLMRDLPVALNQAPLPEACTLSAPTSSPQAATHDLSAFDLTLLCGLNADDTTSIDRDSDTQLRQALQAQRLPFAVVYGDATQRVQSAVQAIAHAQRAARLLPTDAPQWQWQCEKCSDAACEHRLFSSLLASGSVRP